MGLQVVSIAQAPPPSRDDDAVDITSDKDDDDDGLARSKLTQAQRQTLVERDVRSHARSLTEIIKTINGGFTEKQMAQLRDVIREEFDNVGLRIDDPDHIDDIRADFRFLRGIRQLWNSTSKRLGNAILTAVLLGLATIIGFGVMAWAKHNQG